MKQISQKSKMIFISLGLLFLATIGLTMAYYNSQKDFKNKFQTTSPGVAIEERFDPIDRWLPEEEKSKQVWFTNTGGMDMYLRFTVDVEWDNGKPGQITDNKELLGEDGVITLYWRDSTNTGGSKELKEDISCELLTPVVLIETDGEGNSKKTVYYYYNKILKAGTSTEHVLESVKFNPNLSNDGHEHSDYSDIQINVSINGETILADKQAAADEWNMIVGEKTQDYISWSKMP